jgi:release factor glutamine methyltransferase
MTAPNPKPIVTNPAKKTALRKKLLNRFWKPVVTFYLKRPRKMRYRGLQLMIIPGVFHPGFFFSSRILADFISGMELKDKKLLDLGCGSGLVALSAARKGAVVTATDISTKAVSCTKDNAVINRLSVEAKRTDLFDGLSGRNFDVIAVNPPYYRKEPRTEADHAWYAGMNYEYFIKFFTQLKDCFGEGTKVFMILSEDCDLELIFSIARSGGFGMHATREYQRAGEKLTLFEIQKV